MPTGDEVELSTTDEVGEKEIAAPLVLKLVDWADAVEVIWGAAGGFDGGCSVSCLSAGAVSFIDVFVGSDEGDVVDEPV